MTPPKKSGLAVMIAMGGKPKGSQMPPDDTEPDGDESEGQEGYITPPKGFTPPEGTQEGQKFKLVADAVMKDGKICVEAVNGIPLSGGQSTEMGDEEEGEGPHEGAAMEQLEDQEGQGGGGPTGQSSAEQPDPEEENMTPPQKAKRRFDKVFKGGR